MKLDTKKTFLLISHSSFMTGGGEDNFERILKFLSQKYITIGVFPEGPRAEIFKEYCSEYITVPNKIFPVIKSPIKDYLEFFWMSFAKLYKIFNFINNKKIDVCLLNVSVSFMEIFPLLYYKIPFVIYIREQVIPYFIKNIIFRFINKYANGIVANSKYTRDDFVKVTRCNRIEVIYSTIGEEYNNNYKLKFNKSKKDNNFFVILSIAALFNIKNQIVLIKAINELKKMEDISDLKVKIIGRKVDNKYYNNLFNLIRNYNLFSTIEVVGELYREKLNNEMLYCDCIVITSKEEAQSLVLLEALFFEKPVISTFVGIAQEVIIHNKNGLIYDYNDPKTLAKHILELKNNKVLYNKFVKESTETYYKYFSTQVSFNRYEKYILKCINNNKVRVNK